MRKIDLKAMAKSKKRVIKAIVVVVLASFLIINSIFLAFFIAPEGDPDLRGKVVAIWSKGAGMFVRSAGVDDGVLRADRDSYRNNSEGKFLCFTEEGGTIAIMDVMLERYLTHSSGKLVSAVTGNASTRRFTLEHHGNYYYTIKADNGKYVRVDPAGELVVDATAVNDDALFAIVPIRTGPDVVARAYEGWEADIYSNHPDEFPINKVNIGTLQMTPDLYSDEQFLDMKSVWNTNRYETEFILPYLNYSIVNMTEQVDNLISRIKRLEGLGYTFEYVILYHEILAGLPGGPWSDPRVCSQEEIDMFRDRVVAAYNASEVNYSYYKVFALPYQFTEGSLMQQEPYENTIVGCDAATLDFIKQNFEGMSLEVNSHDYLSKNEHADAAAAAIWCQQNDLDFCITSGASGKDKEYKFMFQDIFREMELVGFDKSSNRMHYILHHTFQVYEDRLPEWNSDTTAENSKWLIENVMPFETPSISPAIDTDGDGVSDLQEAISKTYPFVPEG